MKLDISTLNMLMVLFAIIQAAILLFQYELNKSYRGLGWWALGSVAGATGFTLNIFRDIGFLREWILIFSNALVVIPAIFFHIGIARFLSQNERRCFLITLWVGFMTVFCYYTLVHDDVSVRVIITSAIIAFISFLNTGALLKVRGSSLEKPVILTAAAFACHGTFFALRAAEMIINGGGYNYYVPTPMQSAMFLVTFVCYNLWTFGFVSMVNQRLHTETKESKERFELIFNTSPDAAILSILEDGRIVDVNDGFIALTGFERQEIVGKLSTEVNLWKNVENRQTFAKELSENGYCENMESYFRRKDGSEVLGIVSAKITSLHGVPHIISITRDISARRLAENAVRKSEALYRSILAASPDGIVIADLEGPIRMVSPKVLEIFGYEKENDVLGCTFLQFVVPEDRERAQINIDLMFQGIIAGPVEYMVLGANGKNIDIEANAEFVRDVDGAPSNFVIIIREISERKRFAAAQQHNALVQKVLKEITEATLLSTSLDELYEKVHQWVGLVLPAKNFYIALLEKDSEEIDFPYCVDETQTLPRSKTSGKRVDRIRTASGKSRSREFGRIQPNSVMRESSSFGMEISSREWLGAPLTDAKGKAFGAIALNLIHEDYSIGQMDIEVLSIIASQISMAIARKNMEEELKRQATIDELTGIMNRRYFLTPRWGGTEAHTTI